MLLYALIRAAAWLAQRLPVSWGYALGDVCADASFLLWLRGRRNMIDNMRHVLGSNAGEAVVRTTARRALRNYMRYLVDFLRSPLFTPEAEIRRLQFDDWHRFAEAKAAGKGTVFVGLHMGNWDLGGALLARNGYPMHVIMETFNNSRLNAWVRGTRERLGMVTVPVEDAARGALRALRRNEGVAILMDRPLEPGEGGVDIEFCGARTAIPAGAATISLRTGAPIVTCAMVRLADNTFRGMVLGPYFPAASGDMRSDVQALTQRVMDDFARWVQQYPDQWYMFRRMWHGRSEAVTGATQ